MNKKFIVRKSSAFLAALLVSILSINLESVYACTSAIISGEYTVDGRPLLWKNRDTSNTDNKVEYIPGSDGAFSYVALFNASDRKCKEAWMGMNEVGFAVMNTASYNIKNDKVPSRDMDKEGEVMTIALKTCTTVDDFAKLLETLPRPMGVEANFGVIDALGNGAYFETNNNSYKRFDLADAPNGYLVRTNYSHSGRKGEGYGFTREDDAIYLLDSVVKDRQATPELLTETLSRSFYNAELKRDFSNSKGSVIDEGFIPRYKTTATIVIEGMSPFDNVEEIDTDLVKKEYIMWTALGYPPCAEIVPVWVTPEGVEEGLRGLQPNGTSAYGNKAKALRGKVFHKKGGEKSVYIDMGKLFNEEGTGICQTLKKQNLEVYKVIKEKRDGKR